MKDKILLALKEADGYLSGEQLSGRFGITRSAVWKHIVKLKEEGYCIHSMRNRGYRLESEPDILNQTSLRCALKGQWLGQNLITMKTVDSTNEEIKRLARQGAENGLVVAAEEQTAGKGRFSRTWSSEGNGGLYFSLLLRPELTPAEISSITLTAGYAVCLAIREYISLPAAIKWPNDVIIGRKKVCGMLTEMAAQSDKIDYIIIGIGVNVNNASFPEVIAKKATSLFLETGHTVNREEFFVCVLRHLEKALSHFMVSVSIEDIEEFKQLCATMGREVTLERSGQLIKGKACDISPKGELIILTDEGEQLTVNSGEVTVQGIY